MDELLGDRRCNIIGLKHRAQGGHLHRRAPSVAHTLRFREASAAGMDCGRSGVEPAWIVIQAQGLAR